ncbi:MAG: hypothetical protein JWN45_1265 [Acidobacteriaceae bacterium]|nr:hypothetical protein [Acidobacteriaceae bacterium]
MSRTNRAAAGFVFSILQFGTQILLQAILAPVILRYGGRELLGTFAIISQSTSIMALLDFGFGLSLDRFLSQSFGAQDEGQRFRDVFTTARTFAFGSNMLFAGAVFFCSRHVSSFFDLSTDGALQAVHALELVAVWALIRTPIVQFANALIGVQDLAFVNGFGGVLNATRLVLSLIFVRMHWGLVGLTAAGIVAECIAGIVYRVRFNTLYPQWMPSWGIPKPELFREMFSFGFHLMFINISDLLLFGSGNIIVGKLAGPAAVSSYYSTYMPGYYGYNLTLRLSDNAAPAVNELHGRNHQESLRNAFVTLHKITSSLAFFLAGGIILFNRSLVHLWVGDQQYGGSLLTSAVASFAIMVCILHVNVIYAMAFGWVRLLTIVGLVEGFLNILLCFWLGKRLGLGGVLLATLTVITPKTIYLLYKLTRHLEIEFKSFLNHSLLTPFKFIFAAFFVTAMVFTRLHTDTWFSFGVGILFYVTVVAIFALAIPSKDERARLHLVFRSKLAQLGYKTAI